MGMAEGIKSMGYIFFIGLIWLNFQALIVASLEEKHPEILPVQSVSYYQACSDKLYRQITWMYELSPINGSTITGISHVDIPRLRGTLIGGRYHDILRKGLLATLIEAGVLAVAHPSYLCSFWIGVENVLLVIHPAHIRQIFYQNHKHISRNAGLTENIPRVLGKSIFFDDGEIARIKRRSWKDILFMDEALQKAEPMMQSLIKQRIENISSAGCREIDLEVFFRKFTLDLIGGALIKHPNLSSVMEGLMAELDAALQASTQPRTVLRNKLMKFCSTITGEKRPTGFDHIGTRIKDRFETLIEESHKLAALQSLLDSLYTAYAESVELPKTSTLADSLFLLFAGHSTTSVTFQFVTKALAHYPEVSRRLTGLLRERLTPETVVSIKEVERIEYLDWVIQETLRLYPPVPIISRGILQSFPLKHRPDGESLSSNHLDVTYCVKGTSVIVSPYVTHRLAAFFPDPLRFDPERFSPERRGDISTKAYIPFGYGFRSCIGQRFALQELKLMLAALYFYFDIDIENNDMTIDPLKVMLTPLIKPIGRFTRREEL